MKNLNDIKNEILEKFNGRFILLDERFITTKSKTRREFLFEDIELKTKFWTQLHRLKNKGHNTIRYNTENISRKISEMTNNEYELIGECTNCHQKIKVLHKSCGKIRFYDASHFINDGLRCRECSVKKLTKTNKEFDDNLFEKSKGRFIRCSEYLGYHKVISISCVDCSNSFVTKPVNIDRQFKDLGELRCPLCDNEYYEEKKVTEFLINNNIHYKFQYWNKGCKDKRPLKFDFAIFEKEYDCDISEIPDLPKAIIEFDGPQHRDPTSKYAKGRFDEIQKHDEMKNQFCMVNNIPILRITTFNKKDIHQNIKEFLKLSKII